MGIPGVHAGQGCEYQRQAHGVLRMSQAAAVGAGLCVPLQQDGREVGAAVVPAKRSESRNFKYDRAGEWTARWVTHGPGSLSLRDIARDDDHSVSNLPNSK